jgi:hypothetical protein
MILAAALVCLAVAAGFGAMTGDALRTGTLRSMGWSVTRRRAPVRYWIYVGCYGLNTVGALVFAALLGYLAWR